jgi:enamine deaminase RidA (YjgF/YER057c/UK114 family)
MHMTEPARQLISSGTVWEQRAGYSRAVRVGAQIFVSGTTATTREGGFVGEHDAYAQTRQIIANISWALEQAGATLAEITRLRIYVTDINVWEEVARALGEALGAIRPANALIGVSWLVDPRMLVEIDADALIGSALAG